MLDTHNGDNFIYGSILFAALRGSDWVAEYIGDIDFCGTEDVCDSQSFAAKTRKLPQAACHEPGRTIPFVPQIGPAQSFYQSMLTGKTLSMAIPNGLPRLEVVELCENCTAKEHTKNSPIRFLHAYWSGKTGELPIIRFPDAVQHARASFIAPNRGDATWNHINKWIRRARNAQCSLQVTYQGALCAY